MSYGYKRDLHLYHRYYCVENQRSGRTVHIESGFKAVSTMTTPVWRLFSPLNIPMLDLIDVIEMELDFLLFTISHSRNPKLYYYECVRCTNACACVHACVYV